MLIVQNSIMDSWYAGVSRFDYAGVRSIGTHPVS